MPKTLTNDLFMSDDLAYVEEVYKYIYQQIHGVELWGEFKEQIKNSVATPNAKEHDAEESKTVRVPEHLEKQLEKFDEYKTMDEETKRDVIGKLYENGICSLVIDWDDKRAKSIEWNGKKGQKELVAAISKSKKPNTRRKHKRGIGTQLSSIDKLYGNRSSEMGSNSESSHKEFYQDLDVWEKIKLIVPQEQRDTIKKQIEWIQKVHRDGGYDKKTGERVELKKHSNPEVIEHFKNNSKQSYQGKKQKIEEGLLSDIVEKLKELYP